MTEVELLQIKQRIFILSVSGTVDTGTVCTSINSNCIALHYCKKCCGVKVLFTHGAVAHTKCK